MFKTLTPIRLAVKLSVVMDHAVFAGSVLSSLMIMEEKLRLIPATMEARQAIKAHIVTTRHRSGLSVYCTLLENL